MQLPLRPENVAAGTRVELKTRQLRGAMVTASVIGAVLLGCLGSCGGSPTPAAVSSPAPDSVTLNYVALVRHYWIQSQIADEVSNGSNLAAKVCLGWGPPGSPTNMQLIDPTKCRAIAVASLAVHQQFLTDLDTTPAPPQFAGDDQTFRKQVRKAITDIKVLISVASKGTKSAVLNAATKYVNDLIPAVTNALDDVDPSTTHD